MNRIGGVMVCMLASSAVDRRFDPRVGQLKQRSAGRHVAPHGLIILMRSQPVRV
jgi:hypothetical protein